MAEKLVSITKIDKLLKTKQPANFSTLSYDVDDNETVEVVVKRYISFSDMLSFVDGVVDSVFFTDGEAGVQYVPAVLEYAKALHYIQYFSNLKLGMGADRVFALMYNTSLYRDIISRISPAQYNQLEEAVDAAVEHRRQILVSGDHAKLADATTKLEQVAQSLDGLTKQFSGVGDDQMKLAFDKLIKMDSQDLVKAVVETRDAV